MTDSTHDQQAAIRALAQSQFAPAAKDYVTSATHALGADLARLVELAAPAGHEIALDVATGGGHMALALSHYLHNVVASDLTLAMLVEARKHIAAQEVTNVSYCQAVAESLPFAAESFEIVSCRIAAHHFANVRAFVSDAARILRPGGLLLISDHIGLEDAEQDAFMDRFERWRDPSHVRAYSFAEWRDFCGASGLEVIHTEEDPREPYEFASWTARMRMKEADRDALAQWLLAAPAHLRKRFEVVEDAGRVVSLRGTFGIIVARRPAS